MSSEFRSINDIYEALRKEALAKKHFKGRGLPSYAFYSSLVALCDYLYRLVVELRHVAREWRFVNELKEIYRENRYVDLLHTVTWLKARARIRLIRSLIDHIRNMLKHSKIDNALLQHVDQVEKIVDMFERGEVAGLEDLRTYRDIRLSIDIDQLIDEVLMLMRINGLVTWYSENEYWCLICNLRFNSKHELVRHIIHEHDRLRDPFIRKKIIDLSRGRIDSDDVEV